MGQLKIYGASDDLMEFEGDFGDEGNPPYDKPGFIHLSDGSVVRCEYDENGIWRLEVLKVGEGTVVHSHTKGDVDEDTNDVLVLKAKAKFKHFDIWEYANGPTKQDLEEAVENLIDNVGISSLSKQQLVEMYAALRR
jgi:acyl-CoA-binding protein